MLQYPAFNPVAFALGPIRIHWYGLMYLLAFGLAWVLANYRAKRSANWSFEEVGDLIFYAALGVVLGGRIGYMVFYDTANFLAHPLLILRIWEGGMSFHGGLLGVIVALAIFCRKTHKNFMAVTDFVAPLVPVGLAVGRIGNFINGELWGRVSHVPWAMVFPNGGPMPRHPSQLYESFCEGVILFLVLWFYSAKPKPHFAVSALFLLCYGSIRFTLEFFREPDASLGFMAMGWLTMGQLLSIPMILAGILGLLYAYSKRYTRCI